MWDNNSKKLMIYRCAAVLIALLLWQCLSMAIGQKLLMVSPIRVIVRLSELVRDKMFWSAVWYSLWRIWIGYLLGFVLGIVLGIIAGRWKVVEILLWPYVLTIKSVPVASFIIIALIWLSSGQLSIFISFLMVFPIMYSNVLTGIRSTDVHMLEMASVYHMKRSKIYRYIYLPALKPFIFSSSITSIGIAWKAGIAAEVIGIPNGSIGEMLYNAKIYYDTADLFAWTLTIVLLSVICEKIFIKFIGLTYKSMGAR